MFTFYRHLIKLYDSIAKLKFLNDKVSIGMYAKDGEYVEFHEEFECLGQVNITIIKWSQIVNSFEQF